MGRVPIFYPFSSFSSPSCPLWSPKPEAFGPLQQLRPAFGCVRDWAALRSSCHSSLWRLGWKSKEVVWLGKSQTRGRAVQYLSVENSLLPTVLNPFLLC